MTALANRTQMSRFGRPGSPTSSPRWRSLQSHPDLPGIDLDLHLIANRGNTMFVNREADQREGACLDV